MAAAYAASSQEHQHMLFNFFSRNNTHPMNAVRIALAQGASSVDDVCQRTGISREQVEELLTQMLLSNARSYCTKTIHE
jgi:uncharacterized protein YidB (DUF937 family)